MSKGQVVYSARPEELAGQRRDQAQLSGHLGTDMAVMDVRDEPGMTTDSVMADRKV